MNYYETQDFFKKMYPDKLVTFEFDDQCIRRIECVYTEGKLHLHNHVEYNQLKVTPLGMPSIYVPIQPHRMIVTHGTVKSKIAKDSLYMHPQEKEAYKNASDLDKPIKVKELSMHSGYSETEIQTQLLS